jgi:acyl-coenzyme A synthetase/AMP-(fatty) acid ligase
MGEPPPNLIDYCRACAEFEWNLPARFNFGRDVVDRHAEERDRLALIWRNEAGNERRFRFSDIARQSNRFANVLKAHGIQKGDRVIIMLPRIPEWQIAMVGCLKLGAVAVPCIEMLTEADIAHRLADSGAKGAVTTARNAAKLTHGEFSLGISIGDAEGWSPWQETMAQAEESFEAADLELDEPTLIYYTSGSSGAPKGVAVGARGLYCWPFCAEFWLDLRPDDLIWCTADTGWSKAGTSVLFGPWGQGSAVFFYDGPFDTRRRLELLAQYGVTVYCAAATELRRLIQEDVARDSLAHLRLTVSAGETVNPEILERWTALTGTPLLEAYGQTETLMTVANYRAKPVKAGSMGLPLPGIKVAVVDPDGRCLPPDSPGRLVVGLPNPQMMLGYWNAPELDAAARLVNAEGEWFLTGDEARIDDEGYVFSPSRVPIPSAARWSRLSSSPLPASILPMRSCASCRSTRNG